MSFFALRQQQQPHLNAALVSLSPGARTPTSPAALLRFAPPSAKCAHGNHQISTNLETLFEMCSSLLSAPIIQMFRHSPCAFILIYSMIQYSTRTVPKGTRTYLTPYPPSFLPPLFPTFLLSCVAQCWRQPFRTRFSYPSGYVRVRVICELAPTHPHLLRALHIWQYSGADSGKGGAGGSVYPFK